MAARPYRVASSFVASALTGPSPAGARGATSCAPPSTRRGFAGVIRQVTFALVGLATPGGTAATAHATPIRLTFSGTVRSNPSGAAVNWYTLGQPVTFSIIVNDFAPLSPVGSNGGTTMQYVEETASDPSLWAGFSGTGVSGTYHKAPGDGPFERLEIMNFFVRPKLSTDGWVTNTNNHGVYLTVDPRYFVKSFEVDIHLAPDTFTIPEAGILPNPATYLSAYIGTYPILNNFTGNRLAFENDGLDPSGGSVNFNFTTLEISAVPEPSTWAMAFAGLGFTGYAMVRRRRRA